MQILITLFTVSKHIYCLMLWKFWWGSCGFARWEDSVWEYFRSQIGNCFSKKTAWGMYFDQQQHCPSIPLCLNFCINSVFLVCCLACFYGTDQQSVKVNLLLRLLCYCRSGSAFWEKWVHDCWSLDPKIPSSRSNASLFISFCSSVGA